MQTVRLTHEQLALVIAASLAVACLLFYFIHDHCKARAESGRDAEHFKAAAIEAEARARRDRDAAEEWFHKQ